MRAIIAMIMAVASFAAAQTSSAPAPRSSPACRAQVILDTCIDTTQAIADGCEANEWQCLCDNYKLVLRCYDNCPNDSGRFGVEQQTTSYCNAAEAANPSSSTTSATATATATESADSEETEEATATEESSQTSTDSAAAESSSATGAATLLVVPPVGLLAVALGVVGML